jgi:hypothetical protein
MCDYSLHDVASRPAEIQDKSVTTKFINSINLVPIPACDRAASFAASHLGGRTMPGDLRTLLELQWRDAVAGTVNPLRNAGVTFLEGDRLPAIIEFECKGRDDLDGIRRLAYAQAMADMARYCGFVAEDVDGNAIGYWFGPHSVPIEAAPLISYNTKGNFSVLRGQGVAEAILVVAALESDELFSTLREYLNGHGFNIVARKIGDTRMPECSLLPQATLQQLLESYSTDLSTTSLPDTASSVNIMNIHRGSQIDPEVD